MGREVRRVPKDWQHPRRDGRYVPLLGGSFAKEAAEWDEGAAWWARGMRRDFGTDEWMPHDGSMLFSEWSGDRPEPKDYMPDWPDAERTHLQMYEDTSEGTPISPVMATAEELARWLADTKASAFADMPATYEQWLATIRVGSAPSALFSLSTGFISGVEAMEKK